jgi:NAD(P)-dependent dehydrogenase (short-subunit alcohol dehydrogenase family)
VRELEGRAVVVTGGGRGLGRAYALDAAAAGARVVVNDVDVDEAESVVEEIVAAGGVAVAEGSSIDTWAGARAVIAACTAAFGGVDGLVNNAGVNEKVVAWEEDEDNVQRLVNVNVLGTIYCGIHAMRAMMPSRHGSIVNISSSALLGVQTVAVYSATKGAVLALTYGWARIVQDRPGSPRSGPPPESVAPLVTYLLSDLAKELTGQALRMSNGTLSFLSRPEILAGEERDKWTPLEIAAAVQSPLAAGIQNVGRDRR